MKLWKTIVGVVIIVILLAVIIFTVVRIYHLDQEHKGALAWRMEANLQVCADTSDPSVTHPAFGVQYRINC